MTPTEFQCRIGTTDASCPLGLEIWLDNELVLNVEHVQDPVDFAWDIADTDGAHQIRLVIKNKTAEHTKIDAQGHIVQDACLVLEQVRFDDIDFEHLFAEHAVYCHDFNGTGPEQQDTFYRTMGCNGQVTFEFTTPIYLWLLEHM